MELTCSANASAHGPKLTIESKLPVSASDPKQTKTTRRTKSKFNTKRLMGFLHSVQDKRGDPIYPNHFENHFLLYQDEGAGIRLTCKLTVTLRMNSGSQASHFNRNVPIGEVQLSWPWKSKTILPQYEFPARHRLWKLAVFYYPDAHLNM